PRHLEGQRGDRRVDRVAEHEQRAVRRAVVIARERGVRERETGRGELQRLGGTGGGEVAVLDHRGAVREREAARRGGGVHALQREAGTGEERRDAAVDPIGGQRRVGDRG